MAILRIPDENQTIIDPEAVAEYLAAIGINYEQWKPAHPIAEDAPGEEILEARGKAQLCPENQPPVDIIGRYRILLPQNEGGAASLWVRALLGTFEGAPISGCAGNSSILGGHSSKADS